MRHQSKALILALAAALALVAGVFQINPAVRWAEASVEKVAVATAGVYVSLRVINAALSTAQEIEIGASVGAQASVQPLKVLEPVDDTVERVADAVFVIAAGAAVASVGIMPVAAVGTILLAAGLAGLSLTLLVQTVPGGVRRISARAARLGAATALVLPLVVSLGLSLGARMTAPVADAAGAELQRITDEAQILIGGGPDIPEAETSDTDQTLFESLSERLAGAGDMVEGTLAAVRDYREAGRVFLSEADVLFSAALTLIGVFILQTLVLPALLFWGVLSILRRSLD